MKSHDQEPDESQTTGAASKPEAGATDLDREEEEKMEVEESSPDRAKETADGDTEKMEVNSPKRLKVE